MLNELGYLEYEFYDAQAKWQTAPVEEQTMLRNNLIALAYRAEHQFSDEAPRLAMTMRRLASVIDENMRQVRQTALVPEDCRLTYEHIQRSWRAQNESARHNMLSQLTEMGQRRHVDDAFAVELDALQQQIIASLPT